MDVDAAHLIAGAGCAGLSLAVRLADRPLRERGRIVVLDPRTQIGSDRTWCFWRGAPHPFEACIAHRWSRWQVVTETHGAIVRSTPGRPYEHLPGEAFSREAFARLQRAEGVELHLGVGVRALHEVPGGRVRVETDRGTLHARIAWDGRGGAPEVRARAGDVQWVQHFVGWVVRTERAVFDPETATLMDFRMPQARGPRFVYVLPFARDEALVEDTSFDEGPIDEAEHERGIVAWLGRAGAGSWQILRREAGCIPMTSAPLVPRASGRIVPIGLRGGAAKPSTGYAFAFIQRHSDALAARAGDGTRPIPEVPVRSFVASFFDRVFLSYLRRHPRAGPAVFGALFARTRPEALVRFLSEEGGLWDHLAVMDGVPRIGVAREALRILARAS